MKAMARLTLASVVLSGCSGGTDIHSSADATTPEQAAAVASSPQASSPSPTPEPSTEPVAPTTEEVATPPPGADAVPLLKELADDAGEVSMCALHRTGGVIEKLEDSGQSWDLDAAEKYLDETCAQVADGSRDRPFHADEPLTAGEDWNIQVEGITLDAWGEVSAQNQFNDPPPEGQQYVMANISMTYNGVDEPVQAYYMFDFAVVGSQGNTFTEGCGVIPNPLRDAGDLYAGATARGNVCFAVASDQIDGGALRIGARGGNPAFLLLPPS